jgi:hypothetical protein
VNEHPSPETTTQTQETTPPPKSAQVPLTPSGQLKQPLTHQISVQELEAIRACLVNPAEAIVAQKRREDRDKNDEGRKRPPHQRKDTTVNQEQVSATPSTNGSLSQPTPPAVPRSETFVQSMNAAAAVPYKKVALSGLVWGACFGATATLVTLGIKTMVTRLTAAQVDAAHEAGII